MTENKPLEPAKNKPPKPKMTEVRPGVFEWMVNLIPGEAEYIAKERGFKGDVLPITRYRNIKSCICDGNTIQQICDRFKGQKGYSFGEIAGIAAALSRFNGWDNPNRYNRKKL